MMNRSEQAKGVTLPNGSVPDVTTGDEGERAESVRQ